MGIISSIRSGLTSVTDVIEGTAKTLTSGAQWASEATSEHYSRWKQGKVQRDRDYAHELKERERLLIKQELKARLKYEQEVSAQDEQTIIQDLDSIVSNWK